MPGAAVLKVSPHSAGHVITCLQSQDANSVYPPACLFVNPLVE